MKTCEWCGLICQALLPLENNDVSLPGVFVWVCANCVEEMQSEYYCDALCSPIGFRIYPKRPATTEFRRLVDLMESLSEEVEECSRRSDFGVGRDGGLLDPFRAAV